MKKNPSVVAVLALTAVCAAACSRQPLSEDDAMDPLTADGQQDPTSLEDRYSYAYGADLAEKLRAEGVEFNVSMMAAAMQAVFDGREKKMSAGEIAATIQLYQQVHAKKKEAEWAAATERNKVEGETFLRENAGKDGVVVTGSGLQYKVVTSGNGGRKPTLDDDVKVQYRGRLIDGTEFDSTYSRNEPYVASARTLIDGWTEALQLMSEGSKWELYVPANLAYGESGSPPYVGPNAVLIFEVELLEVARK